MGEGRGDVWVAGIFLDFLFLAHIVLGAKEGGEGGEGSEGFVGFF